MKFVDYVTITVRSGKGGAGAVAFIRQKYKPRGGPSGGDGGRGGSVILMADPQLYTLLDLRYNRHHFAKNGQPGQGNNKTGHDGDDIILRVPVGTIVRDKEQDVVLVELMEAGAEFVLAAGGRGGKGNAFFKSATQQTPRFAQPGEPGVELEVALELKVLADVGLVGFPNAGKSTLVATLSAARPKVAGYPFTTLKPSLGVVSVGAYQSFVIADIPGIIEGAHTGKGLGIQFLKHIERNAVLLFMLSAESDDLAGDFETLLTELASFNAALLDKPRMIALTKLDLIAPDERDAWVDQARSALPADVDVYAISAVANLGVEALRMALWQAVAASEKEAASRYAAPADEAAETDARKASAAPVAPGETDEQEPAASTQDEAQ